jgi:hypothetical protein
MLHIGALCRAQKGHRLHLYRTLLSVRIYDKMYYGPRVSVDLSGEIIQTHRPRDVAIDGQNPIPDLESSLYCRRWIPDGHNREVSIRVLGELNADRRLRSADTLRSLDRPAARNTTGQSRG